MARRLMQAWIHDDGLSRMLSPLSWVYCALWRLHQRRSPPPQPGPVPVWVVGNVWAGGTGKTPIVTALVRHCQTRGVKVGVVSRGYGRTLGTPHLLHASSTAEDAGDEPLEIHRATQAPVCVASRRNEAIARLLQAHPDLQLIVSDDGMQHLAMARALMGKPELLLLDEPSMGLAPLLVEKIFEVVQQVHQQGMTILLVEQNAHIALQIANRAYVMDSGLIDYEGRASELINDPRIRETYLGQMPA